ncbi:FAD-dependent oxidoreductase [Desulfosoma caldarium]|uniref:NADPH-dependent 2,4-dienoyl-CoA reductase/sulfur reductase-like enzyme n=1 Tax=Desulfosoma caldarium TaxID=610254 RepID=A0A3N1UIT5_9BACT|nr:FAD-dependent oxidoreductase [Desulfosoma caldarium]ROQ91162.1 NADPH-dependent 2,4-dienoyl-CoA reductase/sulfur reductase-like enzyme [Desulfosoma caldarium]
MAGRRICIVGGVAGGASCAARARRMDEQAEIIIFEKGPFVSFANCGLPYYVGDVIRREEHLLVATPEMFQQRFRIEVRLHSEVVRIDRNRRRLLVRDHQAGRDYEEAYDALVLSPGAAAVKPPISGLDSEGVFFVRTIPDSREIRRMIEERHAQSAVVIGGGYIGLEMTENLVRRGLQVTLVEMQDQVMPMCDPEMVWPLQETLRDKGTTLRLKTQVKAVERNADEALTVRLHSGESLTANLVIVAVGVRPEVQLARDAGLALGPLGGIRVNERMQTSDPFIWAVGDAVEVSHVITGLETLLPLAGPANRQGRLAADAICGRDVRFRGVQGTAVVGLFDQVLAMTGPSERVLKSLGLWNGPLDCEKIYLHPGHHASYYPGAETLAMKLIFSKRDGKILGLQVVGKKGAVRRTDVIAMAMQKGGTVFDLEEAELCYAPQFGSAKDPVNLAGMIAANVVRGDVEVVHAESMDRPPEDVLILDVREPFEYRRGHIAGAVHIPLGALRQRMAELPKDREIWVYCYVGQRSYLAARALRQYGYRAKNLSGGYRTYTMWRQAAQGADNAL